MCLVDFKVKFGTQSQRNEIITKASMIYWQAMNYHLDDYEAMEEGYGYINKLKCLFETDKEEFEKQLSKGVV